MNIEQLFHEVTIEHIHRYIAESQEENLFLDFKLVKGANLNSADDKRNLAKALSGFANSSGGIVIWGVDARRNEKEVDCAIGLNPITPYQLLVARLNELTGMGVVPIVEGVQHKGIEIDGEHGLAVTFIPESISGPHMALLGENRYYKRSGDSFRQMEHFDIEDMFGRRKKPKLELICETRVRGSEFRAKISIKNSGKGSAKAPYLAFAVNPPFAQDPYGLDGNHNFGMKKLRQSTTTYPYQFGEDNTFVIHPGISHDVTQIWISRSYQGEIDQELVIKYILTAEDMKLIQEEIVFPLGDIL